RREEANFGCIPVAAGGISLDAQGSEKSAMLLHVDADICQVPRAVGIPPGDVEVLIDTLRTIGKLLLHPSQILDQTGVAIDRHGQEPVRQRIRRHFDSGSRKRLSAPDEVTPERQWG